MGLFRDHSERHNKRAARTEREAKQFAAEAKRYKKELEDEKRAHRNSIFPDPQAHRAIAKDLADHTKDCQHLARSFQESANSEKEKAKWWKCACWTKMR